MSQTDPVVVTGIGLATSLGSNVEENWRRLQAGDAGFAAIDAFDVSEASVHDGGTAPMPAELKDVPAQEAYDDGRMRAEAFYRSTIQEAFDQAGISTTDGGDLLRRGLFVGSSLAASASSAGFWGPYVADGPEAPDYAELRSYDIEPMMADLADRFGLHGDSLLVSTACAAGASAIALAAEQIASGEQDLAVAVGGDTLELHTFSGFHSLGLLTPEDSPRPMSADRRGMKLGDGFAALVLERESTARAAGRTPLVRLLGWGESADAHSLTQPHPEGLGAALAMRRALQRGGCEPDVVDYVNLHATSTPANDLSEFHGLRDVFGDRLSEIVLHACKPSVGHTLGAAGAVEAVITILAMRSSFAPATRGTEQPEYPVRLSSDDEIPIRHALSNSFGFGGANACLLFGAA